MVREATTTSGNLLKFVKPGLGALIFSYCQLSLLGVVNDCGKRFFPFKFRGDEQGFENGFVSEISVENGTKFISLKSILNIKNHYIQPVNVFIKTTKNGKNLKQLTQILPEKTFNVPLDAVYSEPYEFYFQIEEPGM